MADKQVIVEIKYDTEQAIKNLNDLTATVEGERVAQAKLKAELESGKISQKAYSIEVEKSKETANKANTERKATIQLLGSEKGSIDQLKSNIKLLTLERDKLNLSTAEGRAQAALYNVQIDNMQESLGKAKNSGKGFLGVISAIPGPLGGVVNGIMGMVKASWAFVATPLGAILAVIVGAITALVNIFKKFDPLIEKIEQGLAAIGAVLSTLKDGIIGFITGTKSLIEAFGGMGAAMKEAAKAAIELKKAEQDVEDMQMKLIVSSKKAERQINELLLQSKDRTKSEKERSDLIDQALEIERKAYNERKVIADKEVEIAFGKIEIGRRLTAEQKKNLREQGVDYALQLQKTKDISDDEIKTLAEALANQEIILNDSVSIREKAINRQNALEDKAEASREKLLEKRKAAEEKARETQEKAEELADKAREETLKDMEDAEKKAEEEAAKKIETEKKAQEEIEKRRGEAILKLADLKEQELLLEAKSIDERFNIQRKAADDEFARKMLDETLTNEEQDVIKEEHNLVLLEIEAAYQENLRTMRQQALDEQLDALNQIVAATQGMEDQRISIGLAAFAKLQTINYAEIKSYKDAAIVIGSVAQGLTSLINAGHDKQLASLRAQKDAELAKVGENKEAQDAVNRQFALKEQELKKKQFNEDKKKALVDAAIATAIAVIRGLSSGLPMPGILMAALAAVAGGIAIASIAKQQYTPTTTYAKGGMIGGRSHALGGTKFYGTDGSKFEAEKGEAMFVLKKDATAEIAALSMINESHGGRSMSAKSSHLAEGGEAAGSDVEGLVQNAIQRTPIYVRVGDIETGLTETAKVKEAGVI